MLSLTSLLLLLKNLAILLLPSCLETSLLVGWLWLLLLLLLLLLPLLLLVRWALLPPSPPPCGLLVTVAKSTCS